MVDNSGGIDWAIIATFAAVIVALGIGVYNGWRSKVLEKKRNKRELLIEIKNWAVSLYLSPLEVEVPPTTMGRIQELALTSDLPKEAIDTLKKDEIGRIDTYIEFQKKTSFGKTIALGEYIRAIAKAHFKEQLLGLVDEVVENAISNHFVTQRKSGKEFDAAVKGFEGERYIAIMKNVEEEISKSTDLEKLAERYASDLAGSINDLLGEIARLMA
jgi:hypothetical protein